MKDELLVLLKHRLGIGARRIDPEFEHAARAGEGTGNSSLALDLAGIADIDDNGIAALRGLNGLSRAQGFDLGVGFVEQRFDAAMDGLGHCISSVIPALARNAGEPGIEHHKIRIPDRLAARAVRNDDGYRTSSFIAASRPSIVIGNMPFENSRRMMVVDSE